MKAPWLDTPAYPPPEIVPPEPGDAERLAAIRKGVHYMEADFHLHRYEDWKLLLRLLDAAQSALAESRAECERLTQERDDAFADHVRVHHLKCDALDRIRELEGELAESRARVTELDTLFTGTALELDEARAELARLRTPTATGEEQSNAMYLSSLPLKDRPKIIASALAAYRARAHQEGVREGLEMAARLVEEKQEAYRSDADGNNYYLSPRTYSNLVGLAYAAGIRALTAPEPQEEKQ